MLSPASVQPWQGCEEVRCGCDAVLLHCPLGSHAPEVLYMRDSAAAIHRSPRSTLDLLLLE